MDKLRKMTPTSLTNREKSAFSDKALRKLVVGIRTFDASVIAGTDPKTSLAWYGCLSHSGVYTPPAIPGGCGGSQEASVESLFWAFPPV